MYVIVIFIHECGNCLMVFVIIIVALNYSAPDKYNSFNSLWSYILNILFFWPLLLKPTCFHRMTLREQPPTCLETLLKSKKQWYKYLEKSHKHFRFLLAFDLQRNELLKRKVPTKQVSISVNWGIKSKTEFSWNCVYSSASRVLLFAEDQIIISHPIASWIGTLSTSRDMLFFCFEHSVATGTARFSDDDVYFYFLSAQI